MFSSIKQTQTVEPLCWWTTPLGVTIGVVALVDREFGYWKAYIGTASGQDEAMDAELIAQTGTHVGGLVALALAGNRFAELDFQGV